MRVSSFLWTSTAFLIASSLRASPAVGQWWVGVEVASERFWGGSVETAPLRRSFRPYRPTAVGLALERQSSRLGIGLHLLYTEASLALEGSDAVVAAKGIFTVYSAWPEVSYQVGSLGSDNQLLLHLGPLVEVWKVVDEESRTRAGLQATASLRVPLGGRFSGSVSAGGALTSSPFTTDELVGFELRALWRRRFAVGVEYRL